MSYSISPPQLRVLFGPNVGQTTIGPDWKLAEEIPASKHFQYTRRFYVHESRFRVEFIFVPEAEASSYSTLYPEQATLEARRLALAHKARLRGAVPIEVDGRFFSLMQGHLKGWVGPDELDIFEDPVSGARIRLVAKRKNGMYLEPAFKQMVARIVDAAIQDRSSGP